MSVNQVLLEIPSDIQKGLDSGIYKQYGSVIRNASGHIVKHLKEVKGNEPAQQILKKLGKNKYAVAGVIGAGVVAVGGAGYLMWSANKHKRVAKKLIEKLVYFIKAAQQGNLTENEVDKFIKFLKDNQKELLALKLDSAVDELFDLVYEYTVQFAQANGREIDEISKVDENDKIINLIDYLNLQKEIYTSEAV